jgi:ABC-type transport system involved in cytochrome c biogenesis permease subunit
MVQHLRRRFWIEAGLGLITAGLVLVSAFSREWIEILFRVDPDQGSGSLEWAIVGVAIAMTLTFSILARLEWRRAKVPAASSA